jgi:prepilin-type processing-associated H-X9-DG protein
MPWRTIQTLHDSSAIPPAGRFYFADEHEDTIDDGTFAVDVEHNPDWWADFPSSRHGGAGTLSFLDGHVEMKQWLDPRTKKPYTGRYFYGEYSPGNRDVKWFAERTTELKPGFP